MLMKNLRWVIIQDCSIVLNKYKRKHSIFRMFPNVSESELCLDYQRKMFFHLEGYEDQDSSLASVEKLSPSVNQYLSK